MSLNPLFTKMYIRNKKKEELDENRFQISPPGFNVVYLPYADDYREIDRKIIKKSNLV